MITDELDHASATALSATHGDAFHLYSGARLRTNAEDFLAAFTAVYPRCRLAYSYKTNYLPELCVEMDRLGALAEVVSSFELELASRLGVPASRVVFNGPYKTDDDFERVLLGGGVVNLDGAYELELLEQLARRHPAARLRVGLRLAMGSSPGSPSRFGFDPEGEAFTEALRRLRALPSVRLAGLHCHQLPPGRGAGDYGRLAERMIALADERLAGEQLEFIDLGGGFYSRMKPALAAQFGARLPSFEDYGAAVGAAFAGRYGADGPELILEPGLAVAADVIEFACRVVDVKRVAGRRFALCSGSVYDVRPTKSPRNLPMRVLRPAGADGSATAGVLDIVGCTCMEDDVLHRDHAGPLEPGDWLVFENVGAYGFVLRPPFIRPAPAILERAPGGKVRVLRRAETADDLLETFPIDPGPRSSS